MHSKVLLLFAALLILALVLATARQPEEDRVVESAITTLYKEYCDHFISPQGRVRRLDNESFSTSRQQARALLLAVWIGDQRTFDLCYEWIEEHLSRSSCFGDHLLAQRWMVDGQVDWNFVSDADEDYAYALILAKERWGKPSRSDLPDYFEMAQSVAADILAHETYRTPKGKLALLPQADSRKGKAFLWNPSAFCPAAYRLFFSYFEDERWQELLHSGYALLYKASCNVGPYVGVGLLPDWCWVTEKEEIQPAAGLSHDYSEEALWVSFHLYVDWTCCGDRRAQEILQRLQAFYFTAQKYAGKLVAGYSYLGKALEGDENVIAYAPWLLSGQVVRSETGQAAAWIMLQKFLPPTDIKIDLVQDVDMDGVCLSLLALMSVSEKFREHLPITPPFDRDYDYLP